MFMKVSSDTYSAHANLEWFRMPPCCNQRGRRTSVPVPPKPEASDFGIYASDPNESPSGYFS